MIRGLRSTSSTRFSTEEVPPVRAETTEPLRPALAEHEGVDADRPSRVRGAAPRAAWLALLFVLMATVLHVPGLYKQVFNADEAYLATQAQVLQHGGRLYHDTVDRKPPVAPYLYAAVFTVTGSSDLRWMHVLAILADVATALLLAAEARRRWGGRTPLYAGALFLIAAVALRPTDAQAANFEVFMLPAMTAAMVLAARGRVRDSGLALSVATLTKQTAAVTLLPLAWWAWRRHRWRGLGVLGLSFLVPIVVAALVFGVHDFVFWVWTGNGGYLSPGVGIDYLWRLGLHNTGSFMRANVALLVLAGLAWRARRKDLDLWLWTASAIVGVVAGFHFFGHYYLQLLPPLALLAASELERVTRPVLVVATVVALVPALWLVGDALPAAHPHEVATYRDIARYVDAHTSPDQPIFVWGHFPEVYWASDRRPATRFVTTGVLTGEAGGRPPSLVGEDRAVAGAWKMFRSDQHDHPPALIIDTSTADIRNAHYYPPSRFPQFGDVLRRDYRQVATVRGVAIYARISDVG
jgi:Glycosyltransferase family 87